jgi:hypothetical protein
MDAFAIGFAVFGALVCASALINERQRTIYEANGPTREREKELDYLTRPTSLFVVDNESSLASAVRTACRK